jgi:hypothetical protein
LKQSRTSVTVQMHTTGGGDGPNCRKLARNSLRTFRPADDPKRHDKHRLGIGNELIHVASPGSRFIHLAAGSARIQVPQVTEGFSQKPPPAVLVPVGPPRRESEAPMAPGPGASVPVTRISTELKPYYPR